MPMPYVLASTVQHCALIVEWFYASPTVRGLLRARNQCTPLVGAGVGSNPVCSNFYGLSFKTDFQSQAFLKFNFNH